MLYTKEAVQANIRNREGKRVFYLGKGDQLTSDARDFLTRQRIEVLPAEQVKKEQHALLSGGYMEEKPEHMTHLNGEFLVPKTHPRIRFRGAMDTLEAELLLCQEELTQLRQQLEEILTLARNILRWEVLEEPAQEEPLLGLSQDDLRQRSHRPQDFYGQPHFMPRFTDDRQVLLLNKARCAARAAELAAAEAFCDRDGRATRVDLLKALNRMSSALYILMIQQKSKTDRK